MRKLLTFEAFTSKNMFKESNNITFEEELKTLLFNSDYLKLKDIIKNSDEYKHNTGQFPPEIVEEDYNMKGISRKWKQPFNFTERELEALANTLMDDEKSIRIIFMELLKLNSDLNIFKNLTFKDKDAYLLGMLIGGCCSRMNLLDIQDYIQNRTEIVNSPNNDKGYIFSRVKDATKYSELYTYLHDNNILIPYFPSIDTLENIKTQFLKK